MARIKLVEQNETKGAEKERYDELAGRNAVTNMKRGLLNDAATYDAYMGWYTSWNRLVEVIGEKDAVLYAHAISTTNPKMTNNAGKRWSSCLVYVTVRYTLPLCSLRWTVRFSRN